MTLRAPHPLHGIPDAQLGELVQMHSTYTNQCLLFDTESLNALQSQFTTDMRPQKADLMCGVYQTLQGKPYVLASVKLVSYNHSHNPASLTFTELDCAGQTEIVRRCRLGA